MVALSTSPARRHTYRRPWLYPAQHDAFFNPARYAICEASTKSGKTIGCMVWLFEQALAGKPGRQYWWVAPVYGQTEIAYTRIRRGIDRAVYTPNNSKLTLTLANAAVLRFLSAEKPDTLYGEDVYAAVVDEASRCREESWIALRSTLTATGGPVRLIGNVKGRTNWHYRLARRAEQGEPGFHYSKITADDAVAAGVLDAAEIEDARRTLPEAAFRELYLCEPSDDGGNPFGLAAIARQTLPALLSDKPPRVYGLDLAKAQDWTVLIGLDEDGGVCRLERWQGPWEATIARTLGTVGDVPTLVDATGAGDPILEQLQRARYGVFTGFVFSAASKQRLMEGLAAAIQQGRVWYPDGPIARELETFEYAYTRTGVRYTAPSGLHDDCVCALALAVQHLAAVPPPLVLL